MDFLRHLFDPKERNASQYNQKGKAFAQVGNLDRAIESFTKAIEEVPGDGTLYYNRGLAHLNRGNFESALDDLRVAIRISPQYPDAYGALATAYYATNLVPIAYAHYQAVLDLEKPEHLVILAKERSREIEGALKDTWEVDWYKYCAVRAVNRIIDYGMSASSSKSPWPDPADPAFKSAQEKHESLAWKHYQNAHGFVRSWKTKPRASTAQILEGVYLEPIEFDYFLFLVASNNFLIGRYAKCINLLSLMKEIDKVPPALDLRLRATRFRARYGDIRQL